MATKKQFTPTEEFNTQAAEWMKVTEQLNELKAKEIDLRNKLIAAVYPSGRIPEGTNTITLQDGWVMKVAGKVNVSVVEDLVGQTRELLAQQVKEGKILPFDFDSVIKYKPSFSSGGFNELTAEQQKIVLNCCTSKPGQAGLEFTKPKRATL